MNINNEIYMDVCIKELIRNEYPLYINCASASTNKCHHLYHPLTHLYQRNQVQ